MLIGAINIHRDKGLPLIHSKTFGNIRITAPVKVDRMLLPDTSAAILIKSEDEVLMSLFFGDDDNLMSMNLHNKDKLIMGAHRRYPYNSWRELSYGCTETPVHMIDIDCDGRFDKQYYDEQDSRSIFLDGKWLEVDRCRRYTAELNEDGRTIQYVFTDDKGWTKREE